MKYLRFVSCPISLVVIRRFVIVQLLMTAFTVFFFLIAGVSSGVNSDLEAKILSTLWMWLAVRGAMPSLKPDLSNILSIVSCLWSEVIAFCVRVFGTSSPRYLSSKCLSRSLLTCSSLVSDKLGLLAFRLRGNRTCAQSYGWGGW